MVEIILKYLKEIPGKGIWMHMNEPTEIIGYCDADWKTTLVITRLLVGTLSLV